MGCFLSSLEPILDFFRIDAQSFLYEDMSSPEYQQKKQLGAFVPVPIYSLQEIASGVLNPKMNSVFFAVRIRESAQMCHWA